MAKVYGLERLEKRFGQLPDKARQLIVEAMEGSANNIVAMMKRLAPVDDGDLRDSIGWTWGARPKYSQALLKVRPLRGGTRMVITIYAGNSKVRYAHLVEWATRAHVNKGKFAGTMHPGTKAQPFFFPSWESNKKETKRNIRTAFRKAARLTAKARNAEAVGR